MHIIYLDVCARLIVIMSWTSVHTYLLVFINYHAQWVRHDKPHTRAAVALPAARFYIELTLFIRFDLEQKVVKLSLHSVSVGLRALPYDSRFRFVWIYGKFISINMVEVKITDKVKIGGDNPCFIIAEVGQNHQGDIEIAKKLIKAAKVSYLSIHTFCDKTIVCLRLCLQKQNNGNVYTFIVYTLNINRLLHSSS